MILKRPDLVCISSWRPQVVWQAGIQRIKLGEPQWKSLALSEVAALLGEAEVSG